MDDDVSLPKSTLQKSVKAVLPKGMRVTGDAMDLLTTCCNEFVHLISAQANVVCERTKRTTIVPEHVLKALEELGFTSLMAPASEGKSMLEDYKNELRSLQTRADARKTSQGPLTKEQLLELQQQLFAQARERTLSESSPTAESQL